MAAKAQGDYEAKLLLFGKARELAGTAEMALPIRVSSGNSESISGAELKRQIVALVPSLEALEGRFVLSVDLEYFMDGDSVSMERFGRSGACCEVAVIPPLSGG